MMSLIDVRELERELTADLVALEGGIAAATRRATQYGYGKLLQRNPVLTGFSRSRWRIAIAGGGVGFGATGGAWWSSTTPIRDPKAKYGDPPTPDFNSIRWNSRVSIVNDAPYILDLENRIGKEYAGFINLTSWEIEQKLQSEAKRVGTRTFMKS